MATEKQEDEMEQTAIRLRKSWLVRIDKIAEKMSTPSIEMNRTDAIRTAIHEWMVKMEGEREEAMKFSKEEQENYDRYVKYDADQLARMLIEIERASEHRSNEVARFRSALREIACYSNVNPAGKIRNEGDFDEPGAAKTARKALEKKR